MTVVIRARKFVSNPLLSRKQMILDVIHPELPNVSKDKLKDIIAKKYKVDLRNVVVFGFKTVFGGGRSTGFCLIYDSQQMLVKYEPRYRLLRSGCINKKKITRKAYKEIKGKILRTRGKEITKLMGDRFQTAHNVRKDKVAYLKTFVPK